MRFGTFNLFDLAGPQEERWPDVVEVIRSLDVDVLAVQEVIAPEETAGEALAVLAAAVGMDCHPEPGRAAVAVGHKLARRRPLRHCTGLLWRPGVEVVPGSFLALDTTEFWHSLALAEFVAGGLTVALASYHGAPFGKHARADQAERVVSILTRHRYAAVGADWNCISADPRPDGTFYDADPHTTEPWAPHLVHQCHVSTDAAGRAQHRVDRTPGQVLYLGGLRDVAPALDAPWQPTTGHWPSDDFPPRRIDAIRATAAVVPMLRGVETVRTPQSLRASDHLPVVATFDSGGSPG